MNEHFEKALIEFAGKLLANIFTDTEKIKYITKTTVKVVRIISNWMLSPMQSISNALNFLETRPMQGLTFLVCLLVFAACCGLGALYGFLAFISGAAPLYVVIILVGFVTAGFAPLYRSSKDYVQMN